MTYKALYGKAPDYISELVQLYVPRRPNMRSVDKYELYKPRYNKERFGKRSFAIAAPTLWNSLPMDVNKSAKGAGKYLPCVGYRIANITRRYDSLVHVA